MTKLKTLEDLNRKVHKNWHPKNKLGAYNDEKCTADNCPITDFEEELKTEAVKWVKKFDLASDWRYNQLQGSGDCAFRNKFPKPSKDMSEEEISFLMKFNRCHESLVVDWIKHFFNLTEEDLK